MGFVGPSGVGKTTLLERLVTALRQRGLRVGAVKHASHGFLADRPGKDSYRLYESGADAVALISREQVATFVRHDPAPGEGDVSLAAVLASLPRGLDLVLAEGFSWEPIPRFVLVRAGEQPLPEHLAQGEVVDVVAIPAPTEGQPPRFPDSQVESLARQVIHRLESGEGMSPAGSVGARSGSSQGRTPA
jgi:molybdopterin-guanine dinucleotide biosynthesis protein B